MTASTSRAATTAAAASASTAASAAATETVAAYFQTQGTFAVAASETFTRWLYQPAGPPFRTAAPIPFGGDVAPLLGGLVFR